MSRAVAVFNTAFVTSSKARFEFRRSDLPDVKLPVNPSGTDSGKRTEQAKVHLDLAAANMNWEDVKLAKLNVINRRIGQLVLGKGGRNNQFAEPVRLPAGSYSIYGLIESTDNTSVFHHTVNPDDGESLRQPVILRRPSTISGTVEYRNGEPGTLRLGLRFGRYDTSSEENEKAYYPTVLQTEIDDGGRFRLEGVPPGTHLTVEVFPTGETAPNRSSDSVLERYTIDPLTEGEAWDLPPIVVGE